MTTQDVNFTDEEVRNQTMGNLNVFILGAIAVLTDRGWSVEDFYTRMGELFAPAWEPLKGQGARAAARAAALNIVSAGGKLESLSGDERQAQAVITGWPNPGFLQSVHVELSDLGPFWSVFQPIAEYVGLDYEAQPDGDRVTLTLTKR